MIKIIISALLLSLSQFSYADCASLIDSVSKTLGYPDRETEQWFSTCKVHPVDSSKTIVALAREQLNPDSEAYNLDVLLVNTESGKILQHFFQEWAFESDAVMAFSGITIDTARYKLAPAIRAFGVRVNFKGKMPHPTTEYRETLNLYVSEDKTLKQVLTDLTINNYFSSGEWVSTHFVDECGPAKNDIKRTLAIAKTTSHGYADLLLQDKTTINDSKMVKNNCVTTTTKATKQYTLHFNGDVYVVPDELNY